MNEGRSHFVERAGSALILAVVLVTLLAVVGVAFLLMSRIDRIATSSIADNMELEAAVQTLLATVSQELVLDVPGVGWPQEYHDYPGPLDTWLANLEPYNAGDATNPDYRWRQISDVTGYLSGPGGRSWSTNNVRIELTSVASDPDRVGYAIIPDLKPIVTDANGVLLEQLADADGDGVADSKWFEVEDIHSRKGHKIYAAVRIIDNGAMLNVNTGYKFDPTDPDVKASDIDGSSLLQVNLMAMAERSRLWPPYDPAKEAMLLKARDPATGGDPCNLPSYEQNVIWRYPGPVGPFTPFDISDELEFRYRYVLNHQDVDTRLEELGKKVDLGAWVFRQNTILSTPVNAPATFPKWFSQVYEYGLYDPNIDPNYAYRHIVTTYNMDRIINASGRSVNNGRMANINRDSAQVIYNGLYAALQPQMGTTAARATAAQLAVNIVDYGDNDANVTTLTPVGGPNAVTYYGFEAQPFISEIGYRIASNDPNNPANNYFAVELANPFDIDIPLAEFHLELRRTDGTIARRVSLGSPYVIAARGWFVVGNHNNALTSLGAIGPSRVDPNLALAVYRRDPNSPPPPASPQYVLQESYDIYLVRTVRTPTPSPILLDRQIPQAGWFTWSTNRDMDRHYCRPDDNWNIVYQNMVAAGRTLGRDNVPNGTARNYNLGGGHRGYATVGDLTRVLKYGPSSDPNDMIGLRIAAQPNEGNIRFDVTEDERFNVFQYVTVFDPSRDGIDNDLGGLVDANDTVTPEWKVPGRININTAPWFVMAQLPWMNPTIARAVASYRDYASGLTSIAEVMQVAPMHAYAANLDPGDLLGFPDLTPADGAVNDFEERDIIFSRISNLVTVRSDVFTAYIVVRLGQSGPQKRIIAILDRSDVYDVGDKVKIRAYQVVPDPR